MSKIKIYKVPEEKAVQITIGGIDETSIPGLVTFLSALSGETPDIMNLSGVQPLPEEVFNGKENNLVNLAEAEEKIQNPAAKRSKKRTSVIKKLHEKQIALAKRSGKPVPRYLEQQMVQERSKK